MSIDETIQRVWNFGDSIVLDLSKKEKTKDIKISLACRIGGAFAFAIGLYIGAPAVIAFLAGKAGAFSSLLFGALLIVGGHDAVVVGMNVRTQKDCLNTSEGLFNTFKKIVSMGAEEVQGKSADFADTWVLRHLMKGVKK